VPAAPAVAAGAAHGAPAAAPAGHEAAAGLSHTGELLLMGLSVLIGVIGIAVAYRFYVRRPEIAATLKARLAGPHRVLTNKYYVDELYDATVIRGTMASASGLWTFDRNVVDGAVNGSGWLTVVLSWFSHILDKYIVDGLVNLVGSILQESSFIFRRLQTGLIQNYALLMLFGVFAFVSLYLVLGR
jgi:NADH-quinone oxidoreductase subunit L